jgi:hypothetical protein
MSTVTVTEVQYYDFLPFILWFRKEKKKSVRGSGEDLLVQYSTVQYCTVLLLSRRARILLISPFKIDRKTDFERILLNYGGFDFPQKTLIYRLFFKQSYPSLMHYVACMYWYVQYVQNP